MNYCPKYNNDADLYSFNYKIFTLLELTYFHIATSLVFIFIYIVV